jgi:hypothetical protein
MTPKKSIPSLEERIQKLDALGFLTIEQIALAVSVSRVTVYKYLPKEGNIKMDTSTPVGATKEESIQKEITSIKNVIPPVVDAPKVDIWGDLVRECAKNKR